MKDLLKVGQLLDRSEMKKIMAGSSDPGDYGGGGGGGQQCNCLYCYGVNSFDTFPVIGECDFSPFAECNRHGFYVHGNFGLC